MNRIMFLLLLCIFLTVLVFSPHKSRQANENASGVYASVATISTNYRVDWHQNTETHRGDVVTIKGKESLIFTLHLENYLESVSPWSSPSTKEIRQHGLLLTTSFATGSSHEYLLLVEENRKFVIANRWFSRQIGEGRFLELVDLDGDGYPEIIHVPSYESFDNKRAEALIWKWSQQKKRYVLAKRTLYSRRLKPLTLASK